MIAEINKDGHLTIMPESEQEEFALNVWWNGYSEHVRYDGKEKYILGFITFEQFKERSGHKVENTI